MPLLDPLKSRELLIAIGALILMEGIAYSGNPHIGNSVLYWHHIPEVVCLFFGGVWQACVGVPWKLVLGLYFLTMLLCLTFITGFRVPLFTLLLGSPYLLGFYLQTRRHRSKRGS
ncbi:hypothetical protein E3J74_01510 [Candidatus Bathyarchaeota archaeon]|nr:MAG: hypothetical protein E3J74_01510 [Candidatus Bathyarchaeota archaeon]